MLLAPPGLFISFSDIRVQYFRLLERNKDIHENHTLISDILFLFDVSWDCPEVHISGMLSAADVSAFEIILSIT